MTQTTGRIYDEFAKLMTDAAGVAQGMRREVDSVVRAQAERILRDLDYVTREEFEAVRDMAIKARDENEKLAARLVELEARLTSP
jgi:BMFP domain-containing protein YqiC